MVMMIRSSISENYGKEYSARFCRKDNVHTGSKVQKQDGTADWEYILNVRPNNDMSAATFWEKFFYRLMDDNEVLVIFTEDNQLLIADDFSRTEYAVYDDVFHWSNSKELCVFKKFNMSDVIYIEYNNDNSIVYKGLFEDYSELFWANH